MPTLNHLNDHLNHRATVGTQPKSVWFDGSPIPWMTYPAICYLEQLDFAGLSIFEYGCGASTLYWARHAKHVTSVEHDQTWYDKVRAEKPENSDLHFAIGQKYIESVQISAPHDIIVIDGRWRPECARFCLPFLRSEGLIILDNSERHPDLNAYFRERSFIQVDFIGYGPINGNLWATTFFFSRSISLKPRTSIQPRYLPGITDATDRPSA